MKVLKKLPKSKGVKMKMAKTQMRCPCHFASFKKLLHYFCKEVIVIVFIALAKLSVCLSIVTEITVNERVEIERLRKTESLRLFNEGHKEGGGLEEAVVGYVIHILPNTDILRYKRAALEALAKLIVGHRLIVGKLGQVHI